MKRIFAVVLFCMAFSVLEGADILLAGDSTCASYTRKDYPMTGWGQVLHELCRDECKVYNFAMPGTSSRSFINLKYWDKLCAEIKKGDYVIIQFGHNDNKNTQNRYAEAGALYDENLKKFAADVRSRGGYPIFASSIARAVFKNGKVFPGALDRYRNAVLDVGKSENVPVVDMLAITSALFNDLGRDGSSVFFMCHSNKNSNDRTHTNIDGARKMAELFVNAAKEQKLPIADCFK